MENSYVLPGLVKRRAMLAGELEAAQAKVRQVITHPLLASAAERSDRDGR